MKQVIKNTFAVLSAKEKKTAWLLAVADICISLLDIAFLIVLVLIVAVFTQSKETHTLPFIQYALTQHPVLLLLLFLVLFICKNVLGFFISKWQLQFAYAVATRLSKENLMNYFNGSFKAYIDTDSSVFNRKISQQPIEFVHYVLNGIQQVFGQLVLITVSIVAILLYKPVLFLLLILLLSPPVMLTGWYIKRKMENNRLQGKQTSEQTIQYLQEALAAFIESNMYGKKTFFTNRYHPSQAALNQILSERQFIQFIPPRLVEIFAITGLFVLILLNNLYGSNNSISVVTIGAFAAAVYKIMPGVVKCINLAGQVKTYAFSTEGLADNSIAENEIVNCPPITAVQCRNICFSYENKSVIQNLSAEIKSGDMVAITGISGKGKTTFVHILLAFLQQDSGEVYINGTIAGAVERKIYRNRIAYAKQQQLLINASLQQNITLEENTTDQQRFRQAVSMAELDALINQLPEKENSQVTENGKNFSGGQRQRIILARALYKDADLYIFDEAFSELDAAAETAIMQELQQLTKKGKMILLITHRTSLHAYCNKIISLHE